MGRRRLRRVGLLLPWLAALLGPLAAARAEQLHFRHYGVAEGFTGSNTRIIYQDSRGYLWFGSDEGLSRFDGDRFVTYGVRDGLRHPAINAITEDGERRLWVGTNGGGVARLAETSSPSPPSPREEGGAARTTFVAHRVDRSRESNQVNDLTFDAEGTLWCLTDVGLYRADPRSLEFEAVVSTSPVAENVPMLVDSRGRIWAGVHDELVLIENGEATNRERPAGVTPDPMRALVEDARGQVLVARDFELYQYGPPTAGTGRGRWRRLPLTLGPTQKIRSMWAGPDGVLWVATSEGLIRYGAGGQSVYTTAHGLRSDAIYTVFGDREGSLWVGTDAGPARLQGLEAVSWTKAHGLLDENIHKVIEAQDGRVYVSTLRGGVAEILGGKAVPIDGSKDPPFHPVIDGMPTQLLQDRHGDWWVTARTAVHRFSGPRLQFRRGRRFGPADGIPEGTRFSGGTYGIHEDASGRLWIGSPQGLYRFDPSKPAGPLDFLPLVIPYDEVCELVADHSGQIWVMTHVDVARLMEDGGLERPLPATGRDSVSRPLVVFVDSRGRLWVGVQHGGVWMAADPTARHPRWRNYSTADHLSSDRVRAIAEDPLGRIYLGTPKGIDRLEPETGRVRNLTSRDGLVGDYVNHMLVDRNGYVWVGTRTGLTRLDPRLETGLPPPPPVYLTRVQAAGEELGLPERGIRTLPSLRLGPSRNSLLIEFVAPSFRAEGRLRYQYRLEGTDAEWSPPSEQRAVHYARLAPGSYRFLVRAATAGGRAGGEPASFAFEIAPPLWRRGWFLALAAVFLAIALEALHRARLRRRLELEAVRTRIATDLHDDIGSNLSRIAILTEVARRDIDGRNPAVSERLGVIASVSRDLVDSMGDIVWAVNPARDHLSDLTQRMRHLGDEVLSARAIDVRFRLPVDGDLVSLPLDIRREVFLVFKEAVNNVARHSGGRSAAIDLGLDDGWLTLRVSDDGRGFDPQRAAESGDGNGLASMKRRAERLGGRLEVTSRVGEGTTLCLRVPLRLRGRVGRLLQRP